VYTDNLLSLLICCIIRYERYDHSMRCRPVFVNVNWKLTKRRPRECQTLTTWQHQRLLWAIQILTPSLTERRPTLIEHEAKVINSRPTSKYQCNLNMHVQQIDCLDSDYDFAARHYTSAVYAVVMRRPVCPSADCLSVCHNSELYQNG